MRLSCSPARLDARSLELRAKQRRRSIQTLVKTLSYRVLMIVVTIWVAFVVTGNTSDSITIGIGANLLILSDRTT